MKTLKWLAAGAMALSLAACTTPAEDDTVKKDEDVVTNEDQSALDKAKDEDAAADENGGSDADYGTPEESDADTEEVPTNADEVMESEDQTENSPVEDGE